MACAVVCRGHAAVRAGYFDIKMRVADLLTDHFAHTHGTECRVSHDEGYLAAGRQTRCDACAALLGNADVNMLCRKLLCKICGLAGLADINVNHIDILIFLANFNDLVAEAVASSYHFTFFHDLSSCLSALLRRHTARHWEPCHATKPDFP